MRFEVFLPAEDDSSLDVTLKIEAPNWMAALKGGLSTLGSAAAEVRNVVCDIQADKTILITDPATRRVFRIREIENVPMDETLPDGMSFRPDSTIPDNVLKAQAVAERVARSRAPVEEGKTLVDMTAEAAAVRAAVLDERKAREEVARKVHEELARAAEEEALRAKREAERKAAEEEAARKAAEEAAARKAAEEAAARKAAEDAAARKKAEAAARAQTKERAAEARRKLGSEQRKATEAQRAEKGRAPSDVKILSQVRSSPRLPSVAGHKPSSFAETGDDLLAAVFEEMMELQLANLDIPGAAEFALNLAVRHIDAESGAVLLADINSGELSFAAAHGPKATEVKKFRIQMGQGIAGLSAREGLAVLVANAPQDPRFFKEISEQLGYETRSILCAPMLHEGRSFGCLELINRRGRSDFGADDLGALSYIAAQLAEYLSHRVGLAS
jgi:hypothetical protein